MKGFVYKITSPSTDKIYIGSTTKTLQRRFQAHLLRTDCYSRQVVENGDAVIELIEEVIFENRDELRWRERYHYDLNKDLCVNRNKPILSDEEYRTRGGESRKEYMKIYDKNHKEDRKKWRESHKEEIKEYMKNYQETHRDEIKDKRKEYMKKYRETNREKINEKKRIWREKKSNENVNEIDEY